MTGHLPPLQEEDVGTVILQVAVGLLSFIVTALSYCSVFAPLTYIINFENLGMIFDPEADNMVFLVEELWYSIDLIFEFVAIILRMMMSILGFTVAINNVSGYSYFDQGFYYYWIDTASFVVLLFAFIAYLQQLIYNSFQMSLYYTPEANTIQVVYPVINSFKNLDDFNTWWRGSNLLFQYFFGPKKFSVIYDLLMSLIFLYIATGHNEKFFWTYFYIIFPPVPLEFFMEFFLFPILPVLDIPFIEWEAIFDPDKYPY